MDRTGGDLQKNKKTVVKSYESLAECEFDEDEAEGRDIYSELTSFAKISMKSRSHSMQSPEQLSSDGNLIQLRCTNVAQNGPEKGLRLSLRTCRNSPSMLCFPLKALHHLRSSERNIGCPRDCS